MSRLRFSNDNERTVQENAYHTTENVIIVQSHTSQTHTRNRLNGLPAGLSSPATTSKSDTIRVRVWFEPTFLKYISHFQTQASGLHHRYANANKY